MSTTPVRAESAVLTGVIREIDRALSAAVRGRRLPLTLEEAISYSVLGGGKRLRPALVLLSAEAVGGDRSSALPAACAMELVHCFSLVHDDLPSMDDDDLRRGRPTLHVHAGEAMATLAGDAMMSIAFELIAEAPLPSDRITRLVRELASATTRMINGQVLDTLGGFPPEYDDEQRLDLIHHNKTGALLRAACRMGAVSAGADEPTIESLDRFGAAIGLMFQIVDDLLDVTQTAEHLGKAVGKDIDRGKLTYPGVVGIERSQAAVQRLRDEAREALEPFADAAAPLLALAEDLAVRTR